MSGVDDVMTLIDDAPVFVDDAPALDAAALKRVGLSQMNDELAKLRAAAGDDRTVALSAAAGAIGALIAADAVNEGFARAALEDAAGGVGLIRDSGIRAVKAAIAAGFKAGKKKPRTPRDLSRVAAKAQSRPRPAAVRISSSPDADPSPESSALPSAAAPAPPAGASESATSQTGVSPRKAAATGGRGGQHKPPRDDEDDDARNMRLAFFPLTDLGNAERFRERYKNRLKWCQALGWLAWDGKRWSRDGADSAVKIAEHDTVRAIQREADAVRDSGSKDAADADRGARDFIFQTKGDNIVMYSDKIASWGRSSEASNKLGALSKRGEPYFVVGVDKLDADKLKINVNNGTLVIDRGRKDEDVVTFQPHDPDDLITKIAPVDYDPEAVCPEYDKFIARVQPRDDMRRFLHQWGGISLTGDVTEQKLAFFYGKGGNGKSVMVDAWSFVGGDYGETVPIETFLDAGKTRSAGQASPDLAILPGVRMLRTSEPEKGSKLAESLIKLATGGEPIQARHLNRDFFKFYPQFKLTMSGNYRPTISGTDEGIWRRVRLVPFNVSIPKEDRDIHLTDKLRKEASGILNRLLDGLRDWCDGGLFEPEDVLIATAEYRSASDPLGRFLSTCVENSAGDRVQSSVLHQVYEAWCKSSGESAWKNRGFSMAMDERGYKRKQSDVVWWLDVKLIKKASDFLDHDGNPITIHNKAEQKDDDNVGDIPF